MRLLCAINPPDAIAKILDCLDLPPRPPPAAAHSRNKEPLGMLYSMTNAAVIMMTKSYSLELAPRGIRANAVARDSFKRNEQSHLEV